MDDSRNYSGWREVALVVSLGLLCWLAAMLSGCSHNGLMVAKGKVFLINERGVTYVNGTVVTAMERENTKLEAQFHDDDTVGQQQNDEQRIAGDIDVKYEIGEQITGYLVDLAKVAPEAAIEYLRKISREKQTADDGAKDAEALKVLGERLDAIEEVLTAPEKTEALK